MSVQAIALIESQRQYIFMSSMFSVSSCLHACLSTLCIHIFILSQIETRVGEKKDTKHVNANPFLQMR